MPTLETVVDALSAAHAMLANVPANAVIVLDFYDAPESLRAFSENGGDEDYILIHSNDFVQWSAFLAVCNEDTYHLGAVDGMDCHITITAHA